MPKVGMEPIRRKAIQDAAARIISKQGFIRTTMGDVAKAAKVSTGMINHYYKNKTDLLVETLNYLSEHNQARIRKECAASSNGIEKLRVLARAAVSSDQGMDLMVSRVWAWAIAEAIQSKPMANAIQRRREAFQQLLVDIICEITPDSRRRERRTASLAAELDAYLTGLSVCVASGGVNIDPVAVEQSLAAMIVHDMPSKGAGRGTAET